MRGLYFAKPLEYRLEVPQEAFVQGERIEGELSVTNRDGAAQQDLVLEIALAYARFKELKERGAEALEVVERLRLAEGFSLEPAAQRSERWHFDLGFAMPIKSTEGGPFLLYGGDLARPEARGQIDLPVELAPPLDAFVRALENHFAFEERGRKFAEGVTEVRFKPPASYPTLEELSLQMAMDEQEVKLDFLGRIKAMRGGQAGGMTRKKRHVTRKVPTSKFMLSGGMPNRAFYRALIEETLPDIAVRAEKNK